MKLVVMLVMTPDMITEMSDFSKGALWDCRVGKRLTLIWRVQKGGSCQEGLVGGREG